MSSDPKIILNKKWDVMEKTIRWYIVTISLIDIRKIGVLKRETEFSIYRRTPEVSFEDNL